MGQASPLGARDTVYLLAIEPSEATRLDDLQVAVNNKTPTASLWEILVQHGGLTCSFTIHLLTL